YEISSLIGAGGMGEVYRARDSRLNRDVAIKVLPPSFAADRERLRRFEQEAQAVAALSHPNILAIYDTGLHNGAPYLVSELLEGESLRDVLAAGVPSHRKSVNYAIQIARGLAAAHSKGIAHRDLKPDNIFITRDGQVKILDFGLAKSIGGSHDATIAAPGTVTDAGMVMGTAGYMSPEQVRGVAVDTRTDIFSFGAVLYEMLTGVRAFKRDTTAETMTAILHDEPPEQLESSRQIPPALDRIVRHCLEKSADQRFQSARDLAFDLESAANLTGSAGVPAAQSRTRYAWWRYVAAAVAFAVIAGLAAWKLLPSAKPVTGSQFHQLTFRRGTLADARFTPDGQNVIYTAAWEGASPNIYSESGTGMGGQFLRVADACLLAVSKQGEIAVALNPRLVPYFFVHPGTLARSNGTSAPRPEIENVWAADYNPNNSELAIVRYLPDKLTTQVEYPIGHVLYSAAYIGDLRFSPNGRYLAFSLHDSCCDDRGTVVILRSSGEKVATSAFYDSVQGLAWTPSGDEVWFTSPLESGQIHALSLSGKDRQVLSVPGRLFLRDIAPNGELLVQQGIARRGIIASTGGTQHDLSWLDYGYLRDLSGDGKMVLFEEEGLQSKNYAVYVRNTDGSPAVQIGEGYGMALSADKKWAITQRFAQPTNEIWLVPVGPGEARRLSPSGFSPEFASASFTSDGKRVVYSGSFGNRPARTWLQDLSGGSPRPVSPENIVGVRVSPDGKWLLAAHPDQPGDNLLVPMAGGAPVPIPGLKAGEGGLGWTSDNRLYVSTFPQPGDVAGHIEKLDPRTGARTAWRDIPYPSIVGGITVLLPVITPDGKSYAFGYGQTVNDLYTISAPR
ncbi:MAG TPA: protein kinase, partial [Acidobacteriaceae bacterium]|nr:protein kinase [Acidobacteriaceae bacterium]